MLISNINYQAKQIVYSNSIQIIISNIFLNKSSVSRTRHEQINFRTYSVVVLVVVVYCVHHCLS